MRPLLYLLPLLLLLSACSTLDKWTENRVACLADASGALYASRWGPLYVGSTIAASDAAVIVKGCQASAPPAAAPSK